MDSHAAPAKNIVVVCIGSRGDVQPYVVVGAALAAQGHHVTVACEKRFERFITTEFGLPVRLLAGDLVGGIFHESFQSRYRAARGIQFLELLDEWNDQFDKHEILNSYIPAVAGADIVLAGPLCLVETYSAAEAIGATWVPLFLGNMHLPTTEFPQWLLQDYTGSWFGFVNKWTHSFVWTQVWKKKKLATNEWRTKVLQLPPVTTPNGFLDLVDANDSIVLYQACSVLFAGPKRRVPLDYAAGKVVYTGFLFPTGLLPEPEPLKAFIAKSSKPLFYVGFGSMPTLEPLALLQLVVDVAKMTGTRCVLAAGWTSLDQSDCKELAGAHADLVYVETESVSHTWLFPQMSCLLHHAGLGTLAAALRSGVPQVPCPKFIDQFHNARVLMELGVAPCSISSTQMTVSVVANAIQRVLRNDQNLQDHAHAMRDFVESESRDALPSLCKAIVETKPTFAKAKK